MPRCNSERIVTSRGSLAALRSTAWRVVVAAATIAAVVGLSAPAHAAGERVTITTPVGQFVVYGQPVLLTITAQADSLTTGKIVITTDSASPTTMPVELPGGTAKEFTIVGPPLLYFGDQYRVELQNANGKVLAQTRLSPSLRGGDSVVGVFPTLAVDMPDTVRNDIGVTSHLFAFDPAQFEYSIAGIAGYDVLVVSPDEIAKLPDGQRPIIDSWLSGGGRLVIDTDSADNAVPDDWRSDDGIRTAIGAGEVILSAGAIESGDWESATAPVSARSFAALGDLGGVGVATGGFEPLTTSLARFTNASISSALSLAIAVGIYALVVGPGLYLVFRRRRARIWLAAPAIAILATAAVWFIGQRQRANMADAHGVVIAVSDAGSEASSFELQFASKSGEQSLRLPTGFIVDSPMWSDAAAAITVDDAPTGNLIQQAATSGSFSLFGGRGLVPEYDKALVAQARVENGKLVGTVENHLAVELTDVAVFWSGGTVNVGDVGPSESVDFKVSKGNPNGGWAPLPVVAWPDAMPNNQDFFGFDGPGSEPFNPDTNVAIGLWDEYAISHPESTVSATEFVVAGWSREIANPISSDTVGTTLVAVTGDVDNQVAEPQGAVGIISAEPGNDFDRWSVNVLLRLSPPEKGRDDDVSPLAITRPRGAGKLEVFVGGEWVKLDDGHSLVELPPDAIDDAGVLYVRCDVYPESELETPTIQRVATEQAISPFDEALAK